MSNTLVLAALVELALFACGLLLGAQLQDMVHEQERRRWRARNQDLEAQLKLQRLQALAANASAGEDDMRWHTKQQAGLVVIEHREAS